MDQLFTCDLIAPCGMNCGVCIAYLRKKAPCAGCNNRSGNKPAHCIKCVIKNCEHLAKTESKLCIECEIFPCRRMKQLDYRYRKNYKESLIGNLKFINENGMGLFLETEQVKWTCRKCNKITSIHRESCIHCNEKIHHINEIK